MSCPTAKHLMRMWRSVSLPRLKQGSTLSISSSLLQPTHLLLKPEWRDDGHAEFKQVFSKEGHREEMNMVISQDQDKMTSLGRMASHISIHLESDGNPIADKPAEVPDDGVIPHAKPKPVQKVILDDGTVLPDSEEYSHPPEGMRRVDYYDGLAHLTADHAGEEQPGTYLTVQIPEKINLICDLGQGGSISIPKKVEGDVHLYTKDGDLVVKKLRGHNLDLSTQGANNIIYAEDRLEAQKLAIKTTGRVRAKQVYGDTVDIQIKPVDGTKCFDSSVEDDDEGSLIDISSLYVTGQGGATLSVSSCQPVRRAVRVKSHHGPVRVEIDGVAKPLAMNEMTNDMLPIVELGGVNGNCEISIEGTKESTDFSTWNSCLVHVDSLSPDSVSLVTADRGNISLTLDRKVEADLRLLSMSDGESLEAAGALLAEEEDTSMLINVIRNLGQDKGASSEEKGRVSIETKAFTSRDIGIRLGSLQYVDGWVENRSEEPDSRFERKIHGEVGSVGKIRHDSAADQALQGFTESKDGSESNPNHLRPLFAVVGTGKIVLETVSWLGAIARRYGLEEDSRDLGRTASRRGRPLIPRDE